ncbi:MAG: Gfo/Idh/MocA family oxidoreductase [Pirellulales bacterium]|nr:Gfo/Idh/MocA family oxidoreductase [Pirellulales bacterium]
MPHPHSAASSSRRDFLKTTAAVSLAAGLGIARGAHAAGDDTIKIAFIGCGGRGAGACTEALSTQGPCKLTVMADVFSDRLERSLASLQKNEAIRPRIDVPPERRFVGFDAYKKAIESDVDVVLLTTPPGFRPAQYAAAVAAGKHVFMEKPCCVDGPGYRTLVKANEEAKRKNLSVVVGLQRRHQANYREGIKRIHDGSIGEILYLRTYFNMPAGGHADKTMPEGWTELEYQIRHWPMFTWLSGDHVVEQAVHEIDIANWMMNAHPIRANGMGGRQTRTGAGNGQIFDHHFIEYEFEGGARHYAQARQQLGVWEHVSDNAHGTKGVATVGTGPYGQGGKGYSSHHNWVSNNPYQQEHDDLMASIRGGDHVFDGDYAADSSMTAVLGRMATYSGKVITWDEAVNSDLDLAPDDLAAGAPAPVQPLADGQYPVAMPGLTKAW